MSLPRGYLAVVRPSGTPASGNRPDRESQRRAFGRTHHLGQVGKKSLAEVMNTYSECSIRTLTHDVGETSDTWWLGGVDGANVGKALQASFRSAQLAAPPAQHARACEFNVKLRECDPRSHCLVMFKFEAVLGGVYTEAAIGIIRYWACQPRVIGLRVHDSPAGRAFLGTLTAIYHLFV